MEGLIRLLPNAVADGATNMATDETLMCSAVDGVASLRFYGWSAATLSLGYFQPCSVRQSDPLLANLSWVRRPSGGRALVHHHELTYSLTLPAGPRWQAEPWLPRMHRIITAALADLGLARQIEAVRDMAIQHGDVLCFQQFTADDLLSAGKKVVGSAQRKYRLALMQHGSILLERSEHTPALPGIRETTGVSLSVADLQEAIVRAFTAETGWRIEAGTWRPPEIALIGELSATKYRTAAWNEKR